jgi:hypothetical protein
MTEEHDDALKALEAMGISLEEAEQADKSTREVSRRERDRDISVCLCGHGSARHIVVGGAVFCKPSRMECPCKRLRPVLECKDTRKFLRKTTGGGALHALTLGILAHAQEGKPVKWLVELKCDRCGKDDKNVVPVPVTQHGRAVGYATGYDALLCRECRSSV